MIEGRARGWRSIIVIRLIEQTDKMLCELDRFRVLSSLDTGMNKRRDLEEVGKVAALVLIRDILQTFSFL